MSPDWAMNLAASKNVALVVSLLLNMLLCAGIWRLYRSREALQTKISDMLADLVKEITRLLIQLTHK